MQQVDFKSGKLWNHCSSLLPKDWTCFKSKKPYFQAGLGPLKEGLEPLDYIYIFKNAGNGKDVPKHWHYVGFGLSDIRDYSVERYKRECLREYLYNNEEMCRKLISDLQISGQHLPNFEEMTKPLPEQYPLGVKMNGFGFELTIRIKCNSDEEWESEPPSWPQHLLQDFAFYVYKSKNTFNVGDHISMRSPLDDGSSRIEHVLMTLDPELKVVNTNSGPVTFIQMVGVCEEELQASAEWSARGILDMMRECQETGGQMLVTDMCRNMTLFELDREKYDHLHDFIERMGSDTVQTLSRHKTSHLKPGWFSRVESMKFEKPDGTGDNLDVYNPPIDMMRALSRMSHGSESAMTIVDIDDPQHYDHIYILLDYESARVLPVMLKGRLKHNKAFTFQSSKGDSRITFIPEGSSLTSSVSAEKPFAKHPHVHWLQIYISNRLRDEMYGSFKTDFDRSSGERPKLPKNYSWPGFNLHLTIVDEIQDA